MRGRLGFGAVLLSACLGLCACDEDDPFFGPGTNDVDAASNGATPGGDGGFVGALDGGNVAPLSDGGSGVTGNDAASGTLTDAGGSTGGSGPEAGIDAGSSAADAGLSDAGSGDATTPPARADLGKGDGTDVLMIGDSWMSLGSANSGIQGGVLKASGQPYRTYAIGGTTLLGGGLLDALFSSIPVQYQEATQADPDVKTVIMTAGGNDILQTGLQEDCQMQGDACGEQVTKVLEGLSKLWAEMASDGVQDLVYILYATPEGTNVDFALPDGDGARKRCANVPAPLRCHIVETLDIVMGDIPDGIHPSQVASDRIGKAVVELMSARGMRR